MQEETSADRPALRVVHAETDHQVIAQDDLAELVLFRNSVNQALFDLGLAEDGLQAAQRQKDAIRQRLDDIRREFDRSMARVSKRYGIQEGRRINLDTGAVE